VPGFVCPNSYSAAASLPNLLYRHVPHNPSLAALRSLGPSSGVSPTPLSPRDLYPRLVDKRHSRRPPNLVLRLAGGDEFPMNSRECVLRMCPKRDSRSVWTVNLVGLQRGDRPKKTRFGGSQDSIVSRSGTFRTVSLGSTLAIWPRNTLHQLSLLRRPLGLFAGRRGRPTRKKSP
jgi:hypothetical protein